MERGSRRHLLFGGSPQVIHRKLRKLLGGKSGVYLPHLKKEKETVEKRSLEIQKYGDRNGKRDFPKKVS